jgi:hypothetical protein
MVTASALRAATGLRYSATSQSRNSSKRGRDRSVPPVLLKPERDVPAGRRSVGVEASAQAECDRAACVGAVAANTEPQVLPLADGRKVAELATRGKQRYVGIAKTERCEPRKLGAQLERETRAARHDCVDVRRRTQVFVDKKPCRVLGERRSECGHVFRRNRQAGGGAVTAPASEQCRARTERTV